MIVGTAGHIDHGKTTLVRVLTGVDTDRLPEEKQRGISIELGYAFLDAPDGQRIGFIDVPGHERLVHTMLAGATGIDYALLLVAADDGVMPQTREHLAVLSLLGLMRGAVLITKCDRVADAARLAVLRAEIAALLDGTFLAAAPLLEVSAPSGQGMAALRELLLREASQVVPSAAGEERAFRLAVDRAFSLDGVGTVATGTVHAGAVALGAELALAPDASRGRRARVRSLHAQNRAVPRASAGQRCALNLVGLARDEIERGQWLCEPAVALATERLDARLTLWPGEAKALRSGTPVFVHLGARAQLGAVALLDVETLAPGGEALVQLLLREPIGAWRGDRVVLRDAAASRTLAGGVVLDPFAPARYRRTPERLAELVALQRETSAERLQALLAVAPLGLDLARFARAEGLAQPPQLEGAAALQAAAGEARWALAELAAAALGERALTALRDFHARQPDELGPDAARLRRLAAPRLPEPLWLALLARLREQGALAQRGAFVHLPEHGVRLSAAEQRIAQKVAPRLAEAGFEGAWARDLARDAAEPEPLMRTTLARLAQQGEVHQVVKDLYYATQPMRTLAGIARRLAREQEGQVLAAAFRDATGLGRKRAIQILEYFDRVGLLRRVGDLHKLRAESTLFADEASAS
ncbi:selenocysteine-specific translation elongation factor [Roseateles sp. DAIF2]|uniref:selenocysteine-specific translation elongation factor n=1 Tax=Roseateles sp. DAIF2 TaxID=2714952 RepID=UPI0018A30855|nr:selenocysteine-specific translation elongation factor [Roseateles sp. DAIF2]QPF74789.1 selenocysteine-specific translation elongation factor [Roseateles sp. DAIF2]